jgi:hypothetical protein
MEYNGTPRPDAFTKSCRDLLRTCTYEDIVACTCYTAPMLFMLGPAAVVAGHPVVSLVLHSLLGFSLSWMLHRMGHRLLVRLPQEPRTIFVSRSLRLPAKLTLGQFLWLLEIVVAVGMFSGILAKRYFLAGGTAGLLGGLVLLAIGLALFFLPARLGRLWMERHYPVMTLVGPTEDVINKSFPGFGSFFK